MRKDMKLLNRSLSLAIAAAMTITSLPSPVLAADLFGDGAEIPVVVEESVDAVMADAFGSGAEEVAQEALAPEEVFTAPEEAAAEEVTEEADLDVQGAEVTTENKVSGLLTDEKGDLTWNDPNYVRESGYDGSGHYRYTASYYDISVTDAAGNAYGNSVDSDGVRYIEGEYSYEYYSDDEETQKQRYYSLSNVGSRPLYDKDGKLVSSNNNPLKTDVSYTIKVRPRVSKYEYNEEKGFSETIYRVGQWSDPYTFVKKAPQDPGQVANLRFDPENPTYLYWDALQAADEYEILITDEKQNVYGDRWVTNPDGSREIYARSTEDRSYNLAFLPDMPGYKKGDNGQWTQPDMNGYPLVWDDASGKYKVPPLKGMLADKTYNISVRAVNTNDGEAKRGPWSASVSYTAPSEAPMNQPFNIKIEKDELTYDYDDENSLQMMVKDSDGKVYYQDIYDWYLLYSNYSQRGNYRVNQDGTIKDSALPSAPSSGSNLWDRGEKLYTYEKDPATGDLKKVMWDATNPLTTYRLGKTYSISLRPYKQDLSGDYVYGQWTEPVTYAPVENAKPDATSVEAYERYRKENPNEENSKWISDWTISWKEVPNADGYLIEVTDAAGNSYKTGEKYDKYYSCSWSDTEIPASWLKSSAYKDAAGKEVHPFELGQTYKVRISAYVTAKDGKTQIQADWSNYAEVTFAAQAKPAIIEGVVIDDQGTLSWKVPDEKENIYSYQFQVQDNLGREYFAYPSKDKDGKQNGYLTEWYENKKPYYNPNTGMREGYIPLTTDSIDLTETYLHPYTTVDGKLVVAKDENGDAIQAFSNEQLTYTVKVRAVKYNEKYEKMYGDWSAPATYQPKAKDKGVNTTPAAVTGVRIKTEEDSTQDFLFGATLSWNKQDHASYYELLIKDAEGREYGVRPDYDEVKKELTEKYKNVKSAEVEISGLCDLATYQYVSGVVTEVKDANGKALKLFAPGQTYTLQVRAVNRYEEKNPATGQMKWKSVEGPWSEAVSYTAPAVVAIENLKYEKADQDGYYFSYTTPLVNTHIYYQIAEDDQFTTASLLSQGWRRYDPYYTDKFFISDDTRFVPGKQYYVRAVSSATRPDDDEIAGMTFAVSSFVANVKTPKNISNLKLYKTNENNFEFRFDAVLDRENNDKYVLEYSYTQAENEWVQIDKGTNYDKVTLSMDGLKDGKVYVRARAYVEQYDKATDSMKRIYGNASNVVEVTVSTATSAISNLVLAEKTSNGYVFKYAGAPRKNECIEVEYASTANFDQVNDSKQYGKIEFAPEENQFSIHYADLKPGTKYYIRARVKNERANQTLDQYSPYTNVVTVTASIPRISVSTSAVTSTSVELRMEPQNEKYYLTGYEVQRKDGKKYVEVTKTTDNTFKDKKLKKDTTYLYRVRPYYYDVETGKTKNGTWVYYQTTTWGGSLNLRAKAASATSIKLSWDKVSGAEGYEVYRMAADSAATKKTGYFNNSYEKFELIKTINKNKTVKYTDKKLNKNLAYTYKVAAFKTVDGKKYYINSREESVNLSFGQMEFTDVIRYSNGKVKVTWSPVYSASGYLVEKYNWDTEKWTKVKTLKAKTSSRTFAKTTDNRGVLYRIRAYKGNEYSNPEECLVTPYLAAPAKVTAKAKASEGSITLSWKPVAGADYYRVYRTTSSKMLYNTVTKTYNLPDSAQLLRRYIADNTKLSGYRVADPMKDAECKSTTFVDKPIKYTVNGATRTLEQGPVPGVKYYYYVTAVKNGAEYNVVGQYEGGKIESDCTKPVSKRVSSITSASKPKTLKVSAGKKKATLKWSKASKADGYIIYRSTNKKSGFEKVATITKGSTRKYVNKKLTSNKTYYYKIQSYRLNEVGQKVLSKYTSVKKVKVK